MRQMYIKWLAALWFFFYELPFLIWPIGHCKANWSHDTSSLHMERGMMWYIWLLSRERERERES